MIDIRIQIRATDQKKRTSHKGIPEISGTPGILGGILETQEILGILGGPTGTPGMTRIDLHCPDPVQCSSVSIPCQMPIWLPKEAPHREGPMVIMIPGCGIGQIQEILGVIPDRDLTIPVTQGIEEECQVIFVVTPVTFPLHLPRANCGVTSGVTFVAHPVTSVVTLVTCGVISVGPHQETSEEAQWVTLDTDLAQGDHLVWTPMTPNAHGPTRPICKKVLNTHNVEMLIVA